MQEGSEPALQLESHLFLVPATYTDFIRTETERILPTAGVTEEMASGDLTFVIPPSSSFISLPDICFEFEVCIKRKKQGEPWQQINVGDMVAPINNFGHSIWSSVRVTLANRLVSDAAPIYAYRSYMEALLNHSLSTLKSQGTIAGFHADRTGQFDNATNEGELERKARFTKNHYVPFSIRPCSDLFQQSKNLLPGVPLQLNFVMNRPEFYLRNSSAPDVTDEYKAFIRNPRLYVKRLIPNPAYLMAVTQQLSKETCKYHIERVIIRTHDIPAQTSGTTIANIQIGPLPKVVFVAFVESDAFHSARAKNPFRFHHFNINHLSVEAEGISFPTKPYQLDTQSEQWMEPYTGLYEVLQKRHMNWGELPFTYSDWGGGYSIFGADLTPGATVRGAMSLIRQGNLSIRVQFDKPLDSTVMCIVYMVYDNILGKHPSMCV